MTIFGLIGNPVAHSLSPVIHHTLAKEAAVDCDYRLFPIKEDLAGNLAKLYEEGIGGLNVTVPYKSQIIPLLKGIDPLAEALGAVNTLKRTEGGYIGHNTDIEGLRRAVKEAGITVKDRACIVLGAGGAARAAAFMLLTEGAAKIFIINRTPEKAEAIVTDLRRFYAGMKEEKKEVEIRALSFEEFASLPGKDYICVQCTSVGLKPDTDHAVVTDPSFYRRLSFGFDAVYAPGTTRFMQLCRENGVPCENGLKMLLYQAVYAFEMWHGVTLSENAVQAAYEALYRAQMQNIVLIGIMGAGKTTVGKALAESLGYRLVDTDALIEEREGMPIAALFEKKGEEYFRERETETVKELAESAEKAERIVLSVGGGLVMREVNRGYLKKIGLVVYLKAGPETLLKRLEGDNGRPLLMGNREEKLKKLLSEREATYEETADVTLSTDGLSIGEVVLKGERLL
ncbi:MAG: shikimate dehydrogenase [Lachnospiraceae bacterium]|nr:shikimate dehydrogenase [Lachnospiraceae bacterium]